MSRGMVAERPAVRNLRQFGVAHKGLLLRLLAIVVALGLWEAYASTTPPYVFPELSAVADAFVQQYQEDQLVTRFIGSMQTLLLGYVLAVIVGIPIGLAMGINRPAEIALDPYVTALYVTPIAAIVPLFVFIAGATFETRVAIVFIFTIFEIIIDTYKGAKATPRGALDVARSFGAGRLFVVRQVVIPHDLPYIFTGLRLGIGRAIKGLILAEILLSFANLGAIIRLWEHNFRIAGVLSIAILLMAVGLALTKSMQLTERRLFHWKSEESA